MKIGRRPRWFTAISVVALLAGGCVKKTMATTNNFVTKDGETVIFSLSQNELEMGRFRLCMTPYGLYFGQDDTENRRVQTKQFADCQRINREIALASQPNFESISVDRAAAEATPGQIDDFSTIKEAPKPGEAKEIQGSSAAPQAPGNADDVKVTLSMREVRGEVHSFFTGSHLTPRCWYRFDKQPMSESGNKSNTGLLQPDFLSSTGRTRTLLNSKRLTRYSISSANIVKSILADDRLRNMKFNVRSEEVLQAMEYNKNLENIQGNKFYTWLVGVAGAGALKLTAPQLSSISALLRSGTTTAYYEIGRIIADAAVQFNIGNKDGKWSENTLQKILASKTGFINTVKAELDEFKNRNPDLAGYDPAKGTPPDASNDLKHKMWRVGFLQSTIDREEQFLEQLKARATSLNFSPKDIPAEYRTTSAFQKVSHFIGTGLSRLYRHCEGNVIGMVACLTIAGAALTQTTQFAIDKYTLLGFRSPTAEEMTVEDLEMAANMFSSSKFNIELSREEIELLAATNDVYSEKPRSFLSAMTGETGARSGNKSLGFIPIIGDNPGSGVVCPTPFVAAQIAGLPEPSGTKFQLLKDAMKKAGTSYLESGKTE